MAGQEWAPGEVVLGLYEVLGVVHSGGMGVVHRVRHRGWQVDMAVKTPRPMYVRNPEDRRLFEAEAGTWVDLGLHPHTVGCAYVRTIDDLPRVFAEWVDGGSLAQAVDGGQLYEGGPEAVLARILDIAVQTAWGLAHAHEAGLVHQDVKSANVMLEPDGTAKVTDFGLARARSASEIGEAPPSGLPATVSFGGMTRAYCSPEQAAAAAGDRGVRLTAATDVWSWAVTVLEMFAGRPPARRGQAAGEAMEALLRGGGARVPVPPAVAALLRQCFDVDPAARPDGFGELAAALAELYREILGVPYGRPVPRAARLLSDGLSNHALSLLDLGRTEEAEELWRRALGTDPYHLPSVYNFGLYRWRAAQETGEELVADLEAAVAAGGGAAHGAFLLGAVQLERHEDERAGELLREAVAADPASADAAEALAEWERRPPRVRADFDGHKGKDVSAVAVSADGGLVLSGDRAGRLLLWEPGRSRPRRTLTRSGERVDGLAMDAAGALGAAVRGGVVELWDLGRGRRLPSPPQHAGAVVVAVSGDGRYVAAGYRRGLIRVWEAGGGRVVATVQGHTGSVTSLALSEDGRRALSASFGGEHDCTVRAWDVPGGTCAATLIGPARGTLHGRPVHSSPMDTGAVSPDARYAVAAWSQGPLTVWDARRGAVVSEVPHAWRFVESMALATAARTVLTSADSGTEVQAWDASTGRCLRVLDRDLPPGAHWVEALGVSADGGVAVLGLPGGRVAVRPVPTGEYRAPWCYARPRAAGELTRADEVFRELMERADELAAQGRYPAAAEALRTAQGMPGFDRHPALRSAWARVGEHGRRSTLLSASPLYFYDADQVFTQPPTAALREDGRVAATGRWTGEVDVWDVAAGERWHTFDPGEGGSARDIRFAVNGMLLLVLTSAGTIRQLSLETGGKRLFTDETGALTAFAVNPAGDRILIGDVTGTLRLRDLPAGRILHTWRAHGGRVRAVALSRDGRYAATLGATRPEADRSPVSADENEVQLWRPGADRPAWTLPGPVSMDTRLDFSADGRTLFVSQSLSVAAWDVGTGEFRYAVRGQAARTSDETDVAFGGDGRLAATPDRESLRVWETATGEVVRTLAVPGTPNAFALSADGSFAVTGTDRLLQIWDVRSGRCLRTLEGHRTRLHRALLSRDGTMLLTTDLGSGMWVWEMAWGFDFPPEPGT
ncbi:serine/threonine-protein kinase [Actinomadura bangladeshensis]|uniref:Protein kinase n=1 Tax=Actinomadura bangladeshensis TaxID=453573 RepID=A0A4R4NJA2_9ACTN|nr:serine/threonine-protein kinase [Actinomadura bangladeshensis]TDC09401.1 protein kinase [Actinomadura bangladeshensis]